MWTLWSLRPRRPWTLWWRYCAWRIETYTGMPADEVTGRTIVRVLWHPATRQAMRRYLRWAATMDMARRRTKG